MPQSGCLLLKAKVHIRAGSKKDGDMTSLIKPEDAKRNIAKSRQVRVSEANKTTKEQKFSMQKSKTSVSEWNKSNSTNTTTNTVPANSKIRNGVFDNLDSKLGIGGIVGTMITAEKTIKPSRQLTDENFENDETILLNVGGVIHQTRISTLLKKPETRLYSVAEAAKASGKKEFYFDRNPQIFPFILNYYRIDKLHMPSDMCGPVVKAELDYWELEDKDIEQCCWVSYISYEETMEMLEKFEASERETLLAVPVSTDDSMYQKVKSLIWKGLQDPYSSDAALGYAVFSLCIVLLSITVFVIETLPYFGSVYVRHGHINVTSDELRKEMDIFNDVTPNDVLLIIDNSCNVFFFIEFIIKFLAAPSKRKFIKSPLVISEMFCLIPYYIGVIIVVCHPEPVVVFEFIRVLFATRVLRIFRIFVLMKHFLALKILMFTISASTKELLLLLLVLLIGVVIFACIAYYMEIFSNQESELEHIPLAFWWAVITMTTVGYGDVKPSSGLGYLAGGLCAISGVLVIALSVPVIVNNFTVYYTHAQSREKLKLRKKKFEQTDKWQKLKRKLKMKKGNGLASLLGGLKRKNNVDPTTKGATAPESKHVTTDNMPITTISTGRPITALKMPTEQDVEVFAENHSDGTMLIDKTADDVETSEL